MSIASPAQIDRYIDGDCYLLAWELHRQGGLPIVLVAESDLPDTWVHAAVQLPNGKLLDVHGRRTFASAVKQFGIDGAYAEQLVLDPDVDWDDLQAMLWPDEEDRSPDRLPDTETVALAAALLTAHAPTAG